MTKIIDPEFPRTVHPSVREWAENTQGVFNQGRYQIPIVSTAPTFQADPGEARVLVSGATFELYINVGGSVWKKTVLS